MRIEDSRIRVQLTGILPGMSKPLYEIAGAYIVPATEDFMDDLYYAIMNDGINPGLKPSTMDTVLADNGAKTIEEIPLDKDVINTDVGFVYLCASVNELDAMRDDGKNVLVILHDLKANTNIELLIDLGRLCLLLDSCVVPPMKPMRVSYLVAMPSPVGRGRFIQSDYASNMTKEDNYLTTIPHPRPANSPTTL